MHATMAYSESRGIAPIIFNTGGELSVSRPGRFTPQQRIPVSIQREVRMVPGPIWKKKMLSLSGFEPQTVHPVTYSIN